MGKVVDIAVARRALRFLRAKKAVKAGATAAVTHVGSALDRAAMPAMFGGPLAAGLAAPGQGENPRRMSAIRKAVYHYGNLAGMAGGLRFLGRSYKGGKILYNAPMESPAAYSKLGNQILNYTFFGSKLGKDVPKMALLSKGAKLATAAAAVPLGGAAGYAIWRRRRKRGGGFGLPATDVDINPVPPGPNQPAPQPKFYPPRAVHYATRYGGSYAPFMMRR